MNRYAIAVLLFSTTVGVSPRPLNEVETAITLAAKQVGVKPSLLGAVCWHETKWKAAVINRNDGGTGSYGLCQIKIGTIKGLGFTGWRRELLNPATNAMWAAKVLKYHSRKHSTEETLAAYNAGKIRRTPDGAFINQKYVKNVGDLQNRFRYLD